ncbi:L,D-transpeptidase family protein [Terrimonas sp. NA20]|uniref:L,D-transpeptidase family protein n=1 Tax=Terrimonas ginsenosidimutans TaxID=2908004 RepID=A0ABS9L0B9_9BACT|nr:L,D-transpeptidase family protein [Terrimonas ginsenosidimutans]MCG2618051.1 L,D-transpeptidase family protein [Terrimonas ginsenosidimutans]
MKKLIIPVLVSLLFILPAGAQTSVRNAALTSTSFIDYQKTFTRPDESFKRKEDTLQKQFAAKKLKWPANYIYIRSFKYDSNMEVWVKDEMNEPFKLFKTYKVCALAGTLGPKRLEGDYQVPEGFYYINEFNPKSQYYLSLGINYPNVSDQILSDSLRPGSAIYIHGSCVTVGCIPITDQQIDELYILAAHAKNQGQDYIPVHIFPVRFNVQRSVNYLNNLSKDDPTLKRFANRMEDAFDYFEKYKQLPVIMINDKGEYIVNNVPEKKAPVEVKPVKREPMQHRTRVIATVAESVHQWPQFQGGADGYTKYLDKLGKDMASKLPEGVKKSYVQVEFIVDKDGVPTNFKVLKGPKDEDFADLLIIEMEKMPEWKPALLNDKPVAKKMVQTITIEAD